jgi:prefoldin subunit 5
MIELNATQITWIVVGACSMGGTGYLSTNSKIDDLDKKVAVTVNSIEYTNKSLTELKQQLTRIEDKMDNKGK